MDYSKKVSQYIGSDIILTKRQNKKLKKLVEYVKINSPAMAEMYKGIGEDFTLRDLPVTSKEMIMSDYDHWITTSEFTLKELKEYTADENMAGELYKGKYSVCETSGSTGYPFYMVYNRAERAVTVREMNATLNSKFIIHRPACFLYPADRHMISICTVKHSIRKYPLMRKDLILKDSNIPIEKMIEFLNQLQPKILCTYVSTVELLASEQIKGKLHLDLKEILVGGETLSLKTREYIKSAFHCNVRSIYASTEASGIAVDCDCEHMHLHNKDLIVEPVDENNSPVPVGQKAHKILITSLEERTVPLIRYEISDKVTIHSEPCKCGNMAPWVEVEGRTVEPPFILKNDSGEVVISTFILYVKTMGLGDVRKIQLILHGYDQMECRVDFLEGADEQEVFKEIKRILTDCLANVNVHNVNIFLSDKKPQIDPATNKFKFAYQIMCMERKNVKQITEMEREEKNSMTEVKV